MNNNEISDNLSFDTREEDAEQLVCRLAKMDPDLVLNLNEKWIDQPCNTRRKKYGQNFEDQFYREYWEYEHFRDQAVLISERNHYGLINKLARAMLCKMPLDPEEPYYTTDLLGESDHSIALDLIRVMHNTWLYEEDASVVIPPTLSPDKKQFIENYLQTIRTLNMEDETEGTMANLLYDYCRTMIVYDAAIQYAYGADADDLYKAYGKYALEAEDIYSESIDDFEPRYPTVPAYTI